MHVKNHLKTVRRSLVLAMMAGVVPAMAATHNVTTVDGIAISGYIDPTYIYGTSDLAPVSTSAGL